MKIKLDDIPEGGMEVNANSGNAPWLSSLFIETLGPDKIKDDDGGRVNLQLFKNDRNVTVIGGIILKFHPICDKCLITCQRQQQIPIHQIMAPLHAGKKADTDMEEDEDFGFYADNEIDLGSIIREQIILSQQMVNKCKDDCSGLCPKCGKNLNNGPCKCKKKESSDSPFAVLKRQVKTKKNHA